VSTLPPERPGYAPPPDLAARRSGLTAAIEAGVWQTDPPPNERAAGGVRTLRFEPLGPSRGVLLHLHGGAFRIGAPEAIAPFAAALAERSGLSVICPAYRLAPEHPFPAALNDAFAVLTAVRAEAANRPLIVSGDSAGGGLAAGLVALAVTQDVALDGLILLSPWLDLTAKNPAYESNATSDPLFSRAAASEAAALYLQGVSAIDPLASPQFGQVDGFPPTLICTGDIEVLIDDSTRFARRLQGAEVPVQLAVVPGMDHVAVTRGLDLPGAEQTMCALTAFIANLLPRSLPAGQT
jgi:acetyl esterase/lipase